MNKKTYLMLAGGLIILLLGVGAIFVASRLQETAETSQTVAPNAPQSLPKAQQSQTLPNDPLVLTFNVTAAATAAPGATPTPTAVATPTPTSAPAGSNATATPTPTAKAAAGATASPAATPKAAASATATPTPSILPEAGVTLPTIFAIMGGVLLLGVGLFLAL